MRGREGRQREEREGRVRQKRNHRRCSKEGEKRLLGESRLVSHLKVPLCDEAAVTASMRVERGVFHVLSQEDVQTPPIRPFRQEQLVVCLIVQGREGNVTTLHRTVCVRMYCVFNTTYMVL